MEAVPALRVYNGRKRCGFELGGLAVETEGVTALTMSWSCCASVRRSAAESGSFEVALPMGSGERQPAIRQNPANKTDVMLLAIMLFPGARAAVGNTVQADSLVVHGDNPEPVQVKCGFDGVHQLALGQWCVDMEPDGHPVEPG